MTTTVIYSDSTTSQVLAANYDTLIITPSATLIASDISAAANQYIMTVDIEGYTYLSGVMLPSLFFTTGIALNGNDDVYFGENSTLVATSNVAITMGIGGANSGYLTNAGSISNTNGFCIVAYNGATIWNEGTINASITAIQLNSNEIQGSSIYNSGTISGYYASIQMTGTSSNVVINNGILIGDVIFSTGSDTFDNRGGSVSGDVLLGAGNDTLDSRGGTISGVVYDGGGSDTYYVTDASLVIAETAGAEIDIVFAAANYQLQANIENLTLLEGAAYSGTGNSLSNLMSGNSLNNVMSGLGGNDTINGFAGDDRLTDGLGNDSLLGGDGDDRLTSGIGNDTLNGGDGNDTMNGGAGKDLYTSGTGDDVFLFTNITQTANTQANADQINDFEQHADVIDLSRIDANQTNALANDAFVFKGTAAFSGAAGELRIRVVGNVAYVEMETNGVAGVDAMIRVNFTAPPVMHAGDFIL